MIALAELAGPAQPQTPNPSPSATLPGLPALEPLCAKYDTECARLAEMITALEADLEAVKAAHLTKLKRQAAQVAGREAELRQALENAPGLFQRPRTVILHGTKIGYITNPGSVTYTDEARVLKLIAKHFADRFDDLVKTEQTPRKTALKNLSPAELARIGCRLEGEGDTIILTRVDGDVEKLIHHLTKKLSACMTAA